MLYISFMHCVSIDIAPYSFWKKRKEVKRMAAKATTPEKEKPRSLPKHFSLRRAWAAMGDVYLDLRGLRLTNLLQSDAEHVHHLRRDARFGSSSTLR